MPVHAVKGVKQDTLTTATGSKGAPGDTAMASLTKCRSVILVVYSRFQVEPQAVHAARSIVRERAWVRFKLLEATAQGERKRLDGDL